jgi:endonuclease YncB( thermonuclease family)
MTTARASIPFRAAASATHRPGITIAIAGLALAGCGTDDQDPSDTERGTSAGARVVRVVDGDTVHVRTSDGHDERVRLALVDAPETSTTRYGRAECGGAEATAFLSRLADGRRVELRRPGGEDRDRFGRAVAELVAGGRSVDEQLVAAGWAKPFRVPTGAGGAEANRRIRAAADRARTERAGVWRLCGGFGRR